MREILFRSKRVDNNEWVYGCYYESKISGCFILVPKIKVRKKDGVVIGDSFDVFEVIPETVGQFTGLCDKNGKKIFESDIVKVTIGLQGYKSTYSSVNCTVEFRSDNCGIAAFYPFTNSDTIETEVIGNIYDNEEEKEK